MTRSRNQRTEVWKRKNPEAHVGKLGAMPTSAHTPLSKNRSGLPDHPSESTLIAITVYSLFPKPAQLLPHPFIIVSQTSLGVHCSGRLRGYRKAGRRVTSRGSRDQCEQAKVHRQRQRDAGRVPGARVEDKEIIYARDK